MRQECWLLLHTISDSKQITNSKSERSRIMSNQITDSVFQDCPIRNVLAHICGKWSLLVIYVMRQNDSIRFNALNRAIPDISQKVLTSTLRSLETDGFVTRKIYAEVPPRVEYSLTDRARSFLPLVENMLVWAQDNMAGILKDRNKEHHRADY